MIEIRRSDERGIADHGWLKSRHTFSFANYYDPAHMGVSQLRVINDDVVAPGRGFGTHSHQDMEIISYVKKGQIQHKDSEGNVSVLPAGEFQLMSAGTGISHSEYNPSLEETLEFLQIWIIPNKVGVKPAYQQKQFDRKSGLNLIVSPDARDHSFLIHQDVCLYHLLLKGSEIAILNSKNNRLVFVHLIKGELTIVDTTLFPGDGAIISESELIEFISVSENTEALVFDLP